MRDVQEELNAWREAGEELAIATVISTWGSAPRPVGSKMVSTRSGRIAGSVSAGCVEGAVIEEGWKVIKSLQPELMTFSVADEEAWGVGLACGGTIQVFVEPGISMDGVFEAARERLIRGEPFAIVSVISGSPDQINSKLLVTKDGQSIGDLKIGGKQGVITQEALQWIDGEKTGLIELEDNLTLFVETYPAPPRLVVIGAVHIASSLVSIANLAGYQTIVIDPRTAFATRERFPHASELIAGWPQDVLLGLGLDRSTYVVILTHDPKVDDPALQISLTSDCRYVGALGSRRTNARRVSRLKSAGLSDQQIERLHAPIGIDIGGRSPEELAVSILAEVIQARNAGM